MGIQLIIESRIPAQSSFAWCQTGNKRIMPFLLSKQDREMSNRESHIQWFSEQMRGIKYLNCLLRTTLGCIAE